VQFDVRLIATICADKSRMSRLVLTAAFGRKRTFDFVDFGAFERPLSGKADIQGPRVKFPVASGCFTSKPAAQVLKFGEY